MKKKIIFISDKSYDLDTEFIKNLSFLGYQVIPIIISHNFVYKNLFQRFLSYIWKRFFKSKEIEKKQKIAPHLKAFYEEIQEVGGKANYALVIRPNNFPISFLKKLKKIASKTIAYQWDGLQLFPDAPKRVKYFDRFFVFDSSDVNENKNQLPITNFYFDYHENNNISIIHKRTERGGGGGVYFTGTFINYRMQAIADFTAYITKIGYKPNIFIVAHRRDNITPYKDSGITFLSEKISYSENIRNVKNALVLVDFINGKHKGLSFRTFDSIGYDKKLITTNADIEKYDFYNPNNIFILTDDNMDKLEEFLKKPYKPLPAEIKQKYSFTNWIAYALDESPYTPIHLPFE